VLNSQFCAKEHRPKRRQAAALQSHVLLLKGIEEFSLRFASVFPAGRSAYLGARVLHSQLCAMEHRPKRRQAAALQSRERDARGFC
jgi:hypothetical protein